jgi:hypothetical protein
LGKSGRKWRRNGRSPAPNDLALGPSPGHPTNPLFRHPRAPGRPARHIGQSDRDGSSHPVEAQAVNRRPSGRERAAWEAAHDQVNLSAERAGSSSEILPRIDQTPLPDRMIADAFGVSQTYASQIRRGVFLPHPIYYAEFEALLS